MPRPGEPARGLRHLLASLRAQPGALRGDLVAGLAGAVTAVPSGMAAALLAGVQPIQGLYASFAGPIAGGLTARSRYLAITTTSAAALAAASALRNVRPDQRPAGVALLAFLVAAALIAGAALRVGRYTRFVTHSVMTGFMSGIAVNIICGQLPALAGTAARGPVPVAKALYVIAHPGRIGAAALLTGLFTLGVLVLAARTRLVTWGPVFAVILPTLAVILSGAHSVARVTSLGTVSPGIPAPRLPDFGLLSYGMISGALAIAAIVIVQGAGVTQALLTGDTPGYPDSNQDVLAQGAGNVAAAFFAGIPVGSSLSQTVLNVRSGARTRWGAVLSGAGMLAILAAFSGAVGLVPLPALAASLIYLAASSLQVSEVTTIARTGPASQVTLTVTFVATLALPVAAAVGIGVAVALLQQLNRDALDLRVIELIPLDDGRLAEAKPPAELPSGQVTIVDVYGSVFYAGSRTLEHKLPEPKSGPPPVLVLRLRGRTSVGATFVKVMADYADRLRAAGGRLYLSDVEPRLARQLERTGRLAGPVKMFDAEPEISQSTYAAYLDAQAWLMTSG
jgi:sulfate permease, SulP family